MSVQRHYECVCLVESVTIKVRNKVDVWSCGGAASSDPLTLRDVSRGCHVITPRARDTTGNTRKLQSALVM